MSDPMTYDEFLARAKALRDAHASAECDLMEFLAAAESQPELWRDGQGHLSFAGMLESEQICDPARYSNYVAMVAEIGAKMVRGVGGIDQAKAIVRSRLDAAARARVIEKVSEARRDRGMPLSPRHVRSIVSEHSPAIDRPTVAEARRARASEAETEAAVLRRRVRELEREVARLKRENAKLEKKLERAEKKAA